MISANSSHDDGTEIDLRATLLHRLAMSLPWKLPWPDTAVVSQCASKCMHALLAAQTIAADL